MITNIKSITVIFLSLLISFSSCKKEEFSFGALKTPTDLALTTVVAGASTTSPEGDGSGMVNITVASTNAISYKIDFGDGNFKMVQSGVINYKYNNPGTAEYTVTVNAIGTGGATSTISKKIKVFVSFDIPAEIVAAMTGGTSRVWITANDVQDHFGLGPVSVFSPIWYGAAPNTRQACAYDDEITFTKNGSGIDMSVDNKGESFIIGASAAFYGQADGEKCAAINASGVKKLVFMAATSASTPDISTRIQFEVPGNGIINFGTGGKVYEILSISSTGMYLRNIGADGNAWYQKLKPKI
ncbi:PKD domain-containing protein [Ferruginibacter lapsinanis]|uniref:PKD domain-containing protein n=1 Tax=Ferruginibacter lapsinanis TaxID=563172 RepID=UPI001E3C32C8|nr:PKD domain-containing protein [Ferruginibacter lapsinanis]UEG48827.1 PKD domain-containing protein [Ferruginibacter lapsinanis]